MLIDYFLVLGLQTKSNEVPLTNILNHNLEPEIVIMYPKDQPIPECFENIKLWCFPQGIQYYNQDLKRIDSTELNDFIEDVRSIDQLHHFVLTDEKGQQKFCTSLVYYEKVYTKNSSKHHKKLSKSFPKIAIKQIIKNPLILDEDTQLIYAPKSITLVSHSPAFDLQRQFLVFFYNSFIIDRGLNQIQLNEDHIKQFELLVLSDGLNGAEQKWNNEEILFLKQLEQDTIQDKQLLEFYISILFSLNKKTLFTDEDHNHEIRIIKGDLLQEMLRFRTNDSEILSLSNFAFRPLFTRLSLVNIMRIVLCIISEKQMIFFSSVLSEIPQITEGLLSLIKPLKWSNIYIPCSNIDIWEYTQALQPYIIGFEKKHKQFILTQIQGRVIIDLDDDSVTNMEQQNDDFKIPEKWLVELKNKLNQITNQLKYSPNQKVYQWMEAILKTKKAFFNFTLQILQNVLPYIKPLNDRQSEKFFTQTLKQCFDIQGYINNHPEKDFITIIAKNTMTFSTFIEQVDDYFTFSKQVDPTIVSYVEFMKVQTSKSENDFHKLINQVQDKEIEKNLKNFQNPITIDLYSWLIKYKKFQELIEEKERQLNDDQEIKHKKQQVLYFYDEESRMKTRNFLNQKENLFSQFNLKKIVNLKQIFTHQTVQILIKNYKTLTVSQNALIKKQSENFDLKYLQDRHTQIRRHSTILGEQYEGTKEAIQRMVESLQKQQ